MPIKRLHSISQSWRSKQVENLAAVLKPFSEHLTVGDIKSHLRFNDLLKLRKDVWISCCRHFGIQILSDSSCSQKRGVFWVYVFWPFVHQVASYDTAENYLPPEDFQRDKWLGKAFQQWGGSWWLTSNAQVAGHYPPWKTNCSPLKDGWLEDDNLEDLGQGRFAVSFRGGYVFSFKQEHPGWYFLPCLFFSVLRWRYAAYSEWYWIPVPWPRRVSYIAAWFINHGE